MLLRRDHLRATTRLCEAFVNAANFRTTKEKRERRRYASGYAFADLPEMPEAKGLPIIGTVLSLALAGGATKVHEYVDKRHEELGPVFRERLGGTVDAVFVSSPDEYRRVFRIEGQHPDHMLPEAWILYNQMRKCQRGLFFMEGEEWLHYRRIMNRLLLRPVNDDFIVEPCKLVAKELSNSFGVYAKNGLPIPRLESKLYQWSIEVMLAIMIGSSWPRHGPRLLSMSEDLANHLHKIFVYSAQLVMIPPKLAMRLKLPAWNKFVDSVDNALRIVNDLVREMMKLEGDGLIEIFEKEGIPKEMITRLVADLILAAGDTTAYSMQWALYLLGSNVDAQEKVYESLDDETSKSITGNPLLKGVVREALRLYPTAPFLTRLLPEDNVVGGYRVSKGELILMSLYTSGRSEVNFKNPRLFDPHRWLRNDKGNYNGVTNPHASIPFALGARSCVGRKIADAQLTLTMENLVRYYRMECINEKEIKMILHLVSVPSKPVQLVLKSRS